MESILLQFLSSQIIDLDEDANHDKLIKASKDLSKLLEKDKYKLQKIAITAFDSEISVDDPNVVETKNLIIKHWNTFINKCPNMPLTYVRAVMLEALRIVSEIDDYAAIIWLSASEVSSFYKIESREQPILTGLLIECGEFYEVVSSNNWTSHGTVTEIKFDSDIFTASDNLPGIKADYLPQKLTAAIKNGNNISTNPSYGVNNVHAPWADEFGKLSGEAINEVIASLVKQSNDVLAKKASAEALQQFLANFNKEMSLIVNKLNSSSNSVNLRGQLLWFKEALYSDSQKSSFRKLPLEIATVAMSSEYSKIVPEYCPISAEFFLAETLLQAKTEAEQSVTFDGLIDLLISNKDLLKPYFGKYSAIKSGRLSLTNYIGNLLNDSVAKSDFYSCTGIAQECEVTWIKFTNWLFREFQATKLIIKK